MDYKEMFPVFTYRMGKFLTYLSTFFYRKNPVKWTLTEYKRRYKIKLNLKEPITFYEKMNYWKHFCYSDKQDNLTDKLIVKDVLKNDGFGDYVAKCYFETDNVKELKKWIEENKQNQKKFVIKSSHSCGDVFIYDNGVIIRKGGRKIKTLNQLYKMLKTSLRYNHYYSRFELNYKKLTPMIYVEEYIDMDESTIEYEIMLNYGKIIFSKVVFDRQGKKHTDFLADNNFLPITHVDANFNHSSFVPRDLKLINKIVNKEVTSFPFVRADFVQTKNKTYFMEFTFCKSGGIDLLYPIEINKTLGEQFML